ncbi:hypothetical protein RN001_014266 [Aquatica leii]|uniref:Uncharacterized protein n=1 Tax=Aquatica leii TaxID=1421715 RepID=A0AAN7S7E3_9COLE|nr:hypothetical protein RN001_014266 [Aquatica leii]
MKNSDTDLLPINNNPNFCLIEVLPRGEIREGIFIYLKDVFDAILNRSKLTLDVDDIKYILQHDLRINVSRFLPEIVNIFLEAFLYYCKCWRGWENTRKCLMENEALYKSFCRYLLNKYIFILMSIDVHLHQIPRKKNANTQTISVDFVTCPYELIIGNEPIITNNIVRDEKPWTKLAPMEFLNWPHLAVEIKLLDIHVRRVNTLKIDRYIGCGNRKSTLNPEFITHITSTSNTESSYTHSFFVFYFNQLFDVIKKIPSVNTQRVKELEDFFTAFLEDIKEINIGMGSMQTATTVGFHIGNAAYYRAKKFVVTETPVHLIEYLVPEVDLTLNYFKAEQDLDDLGATTFKSLNALNEKLSIPFETSVLDVLFKINNTCIDYTCMYCNVKFSKSRALEGVVAHFADNHKVGNSVFCAKCEREFEIKELAGKRWRHVC